MPFHSLSTEWMWGCHCCFSHQTCSQTACWLSYSCSNPEITLVKKSYHHLDQLYAREPVQDLDGVHPTACTFFVLAMKGNFGLELVSICRGILSSADFFGLPPKFRKAEEEEEEESLLRRSESRGRSRFPAWLAPDELAPFWVWVAPLTRDELQADMWYIWIYVIYDMW